MNIEELCGLARCYVCALMFSSLCLSPLPPSFPFPFLSSPLSTALYDQRATGAGTLPYHCRGELNDTDPPPVPSQEIYLQILEFIITYAHLVYVYTKYLVIALKF